MELLEKNKKNRPISQPHVKRIAQNITAGKWRFNGDTIKVATTENILDGQHRLWAIIESKIAVESVIVRGIDEDAFSTIDTIRKMRSGSDVLSLKGVTAYRVITASALLWLVRFQRKVLATYRDPANRVENSDIEQAYDENKGMLHAVERCAALRDIINPSILAFLYYIVYNRNAELAERFVTTLEEPGGISISDPFFRFRTWALNEKKREKHVDTLMAIALAFKAFNAAHKNEKLKGLSWRTQGNSPEDFPTLRV